MINNRYLIWGREREGCLNLKFIYKEGSVKKNSPENSDRSYSLLLRFHFPFSSAEKLAILEHLHRAIIRIMMIILHGWGYLCIRKIKQTSADFVKISLSEVSFRERWVQWKKLSCKKLGPEMEPCESLPEMLARKSPAENALTWK